VALHETEIIWGREQTVPPAAPAILAADAKLYGRIHQASDDATVDRLITLATEFVFERTERQLITATWLLTRRRFPASSLTAIVLPIYPVSSVTSVQYVDTAGLLQTWDAAEWKLNKRTEPATIQPAYGQTYPITRDEEEAVRITAVCGHGAASADVPALHKQPLFELVNYWYSNRGSVSPPTIDGSFAPTIDAAIAASDAGVVLL